MVDNVSKKTFWPNVYNSLFFPEIISLKKLVQQELLATIKESQLLNPKVNNQQQFATYLSEKTILCPLANSDSKIGYRCAISFYLSKLIGLSPLSVAKKLSQLLISYVKKNAIISNLNLEVNTSASGYLDFYICDRSICLWLDYLISSISSYPILQLAAFPQKENSQPEHLFPLSFIYQRCNSLLSMGRREGLIGSSSDGRSNNFQDWQENPNQADEFNYFQHQAKMMIPTFAEKQLSWQILWLIDLLLDSEGYFQKNQNFLVENTCKAWTQFIRECRFCGEIKKQNKELAKTRLGLIALYSWCLKNLLIRASCNLNNLT